MSGRPPSIAMLDSPEQERRYAEDALRQRKQIEREKVAHRETSYKDYGKSFRSRPGSADWRARCSCGWESKVWYYGRAEAHKGWDRHVTRAMSRDERKHVTAVRDAAQKLLDAKGYAEIYIGCIAFANAIAELQEWAVRKFAGGETG